MGNLTGKIIPIRDGKDTDSAGNSSPEAPSPDIDEIQKTLDALYAPDDVIEARIFNKGKKYISAGYYDSEHRQELAEVAARANAQGAAVYVNLNRIDPQLISRYGNRIESQ